MGLIPLWQQEIYAAVRAIDAMALIRMDNSYTLIECGNQLYVNLISLNDNFFPDELLTLQAVYAAKGNFLVQLWEDVWQYKKQQVISRISSFMGLNKTVHGRNTRVKTLSREESQLFLSQYHLQGFVKATYNYGLTVDSELIGMAAFSSARSMSGKATGYKSAELVRFASKTGLTIVGGLSKLIQHHLKQVKVNDIMTYADRDWSLGNGYVKLGFELTTITPPSFIYLNNETGLRYFPHRLPRSIVSRFEAQQECALEDFMTKQSYKKVFNTGNLKYHLYT